MSSIPPKSRPRRPNAKDSFKNAVRAAGRSCGFSGVNSDVKAGEGAALYFLLRVTINT